MQFLEQLGGSWLTFDPRTEQDIPQSSPFDIPSLPEDVINGILQRLTFAGDYDTLLSCSLVCRSWVSPSQRHIFEEIHLTSKSYDCRQRLLKVFGTSAHLSQYCRTIVLDFDLSPDLKYANDIPLLLEHFSHAWRLELNAHSSHLALADLLPKVVLSLRSLVSNPFFEALVLRNWTITQGGRELLSILSPCAHALTSLELLTDDIHYHQLNLPQLEMSIGGMNWAVDDEDSMDGTDKHTVPTLLQILQDITIPRNFEFPRLRALRFSGATPSFEGITLEMPALRKARCSISLTTPARPYASRRLPFPGIPHDLADLTLDICFYRYAFHMEELYISQLPDFNDCPALRRLRVVTYPWGAVGFPATPHFLDLFFSSIPEANLPFLESFIIEFSIQLPYGWHNGALETTVANLVRLVDAGSLTEVVLVISASRDDYSTWWMGYKEKWAAEAVRCIQAECNSLHARGVLKIQLRVKEDEEYGDEGVFEIVSSPLCPAQHSS